MTETVAAITTVWRPSGLGLRAGYAESTARTLMRLHRAKGRCHHSAPVAAANSWTRLRCLYCTQAALLRLAASSSTENFDEHADTPPRLLSRGRTARGVLCYMGDAALMVRVRVSVSTVCLLAWT